MHPGTELMGITAAGLMGDRSHEVIENVANGVTVVRLTGPLVKSECAMSVREDVLDLVAHGAKKLAVDLEKVDDIDSSGLGALAAIYNCLHEVRGQVRYFMVGPRVMRTLQTTHLDRVFALFPDERSALSGY
jgi:anti-sigma B factor antagonist